MNKYSKEMLIGIKGDMIEKLYDIKREVDFLRKKNVGDSAIAEEIAKKFNCKTELKPATWGICTPNAIIKQMKSNTVVLLVYNDTKDID